VTTMTLNAKQVLSFCRGGVGHFAASRPTFLAPVSGVLYDERCIGIITSTASAYLTALVSDDLAASDETIISSNHMAPTFAN
jgi:hypothetical protein